MEGERCKRKRITVDGNNMYLIVGKDFIDITVAFENRPENLKLRQIIQEVCEHASELMK